MWLVVIQEGQGKAQAPLWHAENIFSYLTTELLMSVGNTDIKESH